MTTRQTSRAKLQKAACALCHSEMDVTLIQGSDRPYCLVYEGHCSKCNGYALLTYIADKRIQDEDL